MDISYCVRTFMMVSDWVLSTHLITLVLSLIVEPRLLGQYRWCLGWLQNPSGAIEEGCIVDAEAKAREAKGRAGAR